MNSWRFKSIQSNITLAFVLLIVLTSLILSLVSYYLSKEAVQTNAQQYTTELIKQVNTNIQTYVTSMKNIANLAASNRDIRAYLSGEQTGTLVEKQEAEAKISDFFHSILISRSDIASINIFGYEGQFVTGRQNARLNPNIDVTTLPWYKNALRAEGENVISSSHVQPIFEDEYRWVVSLSRELRSSDGTHGLGILNVDLNFSVMNNMFSTINLGKRGYLFIVDENGNIVYHPQQQLIYSNLKTERIDQVLATRSGSFMTEEGADSRMYTVQDSGFGWKVVGVSYVKELVSNKNEMQLSFLALGLICVVIAVMLSVFLSGRLSKPIKQLQEHMKEVEKGNFDIQVPVSFTKEIGRLARTFNLMVAKIKELMDQVVRDQELKRKSELNALQAQINPHFLYNTLDSIVWMAESKKSEEVVLMTSALAKLFRASISRGEELVPIRTEMDHITNYLTIQKMRYKDKIDYEVRIDEAILGYKTIKIILQPIVENAIYHGLKMQQGVGKITIMSEETDTDILLFVIDNGIGMDEEKMRSLLMRDARRDNGRGVGIQNVHDRLQLYFGSEYGLTFESEPGEGTTVTIRMPKLHESAGRRDSWESES
ncbi:cache domain-containing sensor histidine kinase [Paenibacillus abyssi]|uniref:histidine kinase n=1 Tax=Paenibacillus abyssi TaxID=1340531 RepID=A0A917D0U1_9BACL|nr:sensor histidine kinase [Paenibacillus abyssi]GGG05903.1 histidine kinase [Paenibacillus abyssi]